MRYTIIFTILTIVLTTTNSVRAQETFPNNRKEITLGVGISKVGITDNRFSARTFTSIQPSYHFGYKSQTEKHRHDVSVDFRMNMKSDNSKLFDMTFINPTFSYSFQKKANQYWIGGVLTTNTLLNFPRSKTGHYNNNPISYSISSAIGPKISYASATADNRLSFEADIETSLLAYVVRPAYGHPYPSRFLESGTFTPTREGMAGPLARSGKIMTLGAFNSFKLVLGISYMIGDHVKFGLNMNLQHLSVSDINELSTTSADILFTTSYVY